MSVASSAPEVSSRIQMTEATMLIAMIAAPCFERGLLERTAIAIPRPNPIGGIAKAMMYARASSRFALPVRARDAAPFVDA